jgi:NAD(P)H-dependent flavin oxidoreductase YrpB (nitropropane dioxygenase family)
MKQLTIGHLKCSLPIIQGGMGVGISLSGLASAVANEGGIGVISAAGLGMLYKGEGNFLENSIIGLRSEIRKARKLTNGVIGVNIMVAMTNYADMIRTSIEEGIDIIFSGAGLPLDLPSYLTPDSRTLLVPIVSSARAAELICNKWYSTYNYIPSAIVVEGPEAGGHLGFKLNQLTDRAFALEELIPQVVKVARSFGKTNNCEIPVIAAGGIYTGSDIHKFFMLGASAVQMGTRFVATHECDASPEFKQRYLDAKKEDIKIIQSPVGMPGRAINSPFLEAVEAGEKKPKSCPVNCIKTCDVDKVPYCIINSLTSALKGNFVRGYAFAGSNVWRVNKIIKVRELIKELKEEYRLSINETFITPLCLVS